MPADVQILDQLIRITLSGQVTMADLMQVAEIAREIESRPGTCPNRIADLSAVEGLQLDFAKMESFAAKRRHAPLKNKVKSAIVAPRPVQYGFARMFQTLNDNPRIHIRIFTDAAEALRWVGE